MRADGRRIVFVSDRDGNSEIYRMEDDGDTPENLSNSPSGDVTPYWSPDGEWIVFVSDREGDLDLYVMRSNGADPAPLVSEPSADRSPSWR